jgi:hypothetical protein
MEYGVCARESAAVALADRVGADVVLLQEAQPTGFWTGPLIGAPVRVVRGVAGLWFVLACSKRSPSRTTPVGSQGLGGVATAMAGPRTCFPCTLQRRTRTYAGAPMWRSRSRSLRLSASRSPRPGGSSSAGTSIFKSLGERLTSEQIRADKAEPRALQQFRKRGLSIAWRDVHPRRALPQSLRWSGAPTTPFHCDGFLTRGFTNAAMACNIMCSEGQTRVSDHNPCLAVAGESSCRPRGGRCAEAPPRLKRRRVRRTLEASCSVVVYRSRFPEHGIRGSHRVGRTVWIARLASACTCEIWSKTET